MERIFANYNNMPLKHRLNDTFHSPDPPEGRPTQPSLITNTEVKQAKPLEKEYNLADGEGVMVKYLCKRFIATLLESQPFTYLLNLNR